MLATVTTAGIRLVKGLAGVPRLPPGAWKAAVLSLGMHACLMALLFQVGPASKPLPAPITVYLESGQAAGAQGHAVFKRRTAAGINTAVRPRPPETTREPSNPDPSGPATAETGSGNTEGGPGWEGAGESASGGRYACEHLAAIRARILENTAYPLLARRLGWQGEAWISFMVDAGGKVSELAVLRSSGHECLDQNILRAVRASEPFPRPGQSVRLIVPVRYTLTGPAAGGR